MRGIIYLALRRYSTSCHRGYKFTDNLKQKEKGDEEQYVKQHERKKMKKSTNNLSFVKLQRKIIELQILEIQSKINELKK